MTTKTYDKKEVDTGDLPIDEVGEDSDLPIDPPSKKKVGGEEPSYTFPTTVSEVLSTGRRKTQEDEKNKFIKPLPPQTFQQGVKKDKLEYSMIPEKKGSYWGGVYNSVVDLVSEIAGGATETVNLIQDASDQLNEAILGKDSGQGSMVRTQDPTRREQVQREQVNNFIEKARSASSTKENEAARSHFDVTDGVQKEDVDALMFQAPKTILSMLAGAASGGSTFFFESTNATAKELKESGVDKDLTAAERLGIIGTLGVAQSVIEKFGIDQVLKSTGLTKKLQQKVANEVIQELTKKGVKATTQEIERLTLQKVSKLSSQINRIGIKAATSFLAEGGTEVAQEVADSGLKLLANKVTGKKVFNEQDITANFIKNAINAGAMGGAFGGGIGGAVGVMSNTKKALRRQIAQAQSPEDVANIQQSINEQVELGNITPQEAEAANITAQQYAEIAAKIPGEVDAEKKYALIGGIEQREDLKKSIAEASEELAATDEAFHEPINDRIELFNAKLEQTNDYIDGLVTGKKTTYKKSGDEFFKTDAEGNEIPISKLHYELATAIREQDAINNKKPEINPQDQKTFEFDADEDVPTELEKTQPIAIRETEDGKVEATYSGEQLIKAGLAAKPKELTEIQAAKILAKIPALNDIDQAMADENPIGMVKFIAEQANGGRRKDMLEQGFLESVIDEAVKAFPPTTEDVVPSLKDVDSTTKALREAVKNDYRTMYGINNIEQDIDISDIVEKSNINSQTISGAIEDIKSNKKSQSSSTPLLVATNDGRYFISDGFHRVAQSIIDGKKSIKAKVVYENELQASKDYHRYKSESKNKQFTDVVEKTLTPQQTKVSPTTEQATQEVLKRPKEWGSMKDKEVEVKTLDGSKVKMKARDAYVELSKQWKKLDNVLTKCL